MKGNFEEYY